MRERFKYWALWGALVVVTLAIAYSLGPLVQQQTFENLNTLAQVQPPFSLPFCILLGPQMNICPLPPLTAPRLVPISTICTAGGTGLALIENAIVEPRVMSTARVQIGIGEKMVSVPVSAYAQSKDGKRVNAVFYGVPPGLPDGVGSISLLVSSIPPPPNPPPPRSPLPKPPPQPPQAISLTAPFLSDQTCGVHGGKGIRPQDIEAEFVVGEVLFFLKDELTAEQTLAAFHRLKPLFKSIRKIEIVDMFVGVLKDETPEATIAAAEALQKDPAIQYATPHWLQTELQLIPNDPKVPEQAHLQLLNMFVGWQRFFPTQGLGITIAVIDTGLDLKQVNGPVKEFGTPLWAPIGIDVSPDSRERITPGGYGEAADQRGHGTIVGGIAGARGNNGNAGVGLAFNATIFPIRVFGESPYTTLESVITGLVAAILAEADVANLSLGCSRCRPSTEKGHRDTYEMIFKRLQRALALGRLKLEKVTVIVAASGNDGEKLVDSPAASPNVIGVGSWNPKNKERSFFSNYGPEVDFVAAGDNVMTALLGGEFGGSGPGTSFAAPQVAGLVALMLSTQPKLADGGVERIIEQIRACFNVDVGTSGFDEETGWGMIRIPDPKEVDRTKCLVF